MSTYNISQLNPSYPNINHHHISEYQSSSISEYLSAINYKNLNTNDGRTGREEQQTWLKIKINQLERLQLPAPLKTYTLPPQRDPRQQKVRSHDVLHHPPAHPPQHPPRRHRQLRPRRSQYLSHYSDILYSILFFFIFNPVVMFLFYRCTIWFM